MIADGCPGRRLVYAGWMYRSSSLLGLATLVTLSVACGDDGTSTSNDGSDGGGGGSGGQVNNDGGSGATPAVGAGSEGGAPATGCESGPLASPIPGCAPAPLASSGDPHQDCVDRINQLRYECQCLPPLARWTDGEACSDGQSADDQATNSAHGHFGSCGESAQNTCPNWGSNADVIGGCLQSMWDEGPGEPFSAHGHYINMSNTGYTKVACGFADAAGVWSNQNFSP